MSVRSTFRFLRWVAVLVLLVVVFDLTFIRTMYYQSPMAERSAVGRGWTTQGFSVGIVWPPHTDASLVEGVTLASEEVNAGGGPLANKIRLRFFTEVDDGGAMARDTVAPINDIVAVIGHEIEGNVIPASLTYQENGILFLSPKSTDMRLTAHNFSYVFRMTPDDATMTNDMAEFAKAQNWKRIGIIYGQNDHGVSASGLFLTEARRDGVRAPFFRSYLNAKDWEGQDHRPLLADVRTTPLDAIMLADGLPWAAMVLRDMAAIEYTPPVLATDKLDSTQVWGLSGQNANNLYVASAVDPDSAEPAFVAFKSRFHKRFGVNPGYGATQGYESFMLFVNACLASRTADPIAVSTTIRTRTWQGLFGDFGFTADGDVTGRDVSIKRMQNGRFVTLRTIREDVH
jgi:branched-chain amino acid transport system substrate-binding protein